MAQAVPVKIVSSQNLETTRKYRVSQIKLSIKNFNFDLLITLLDSFLTSLDSVNLYVWFGISFIRFGSLKVTIDFP